MIKAVLIGAAHMHINEIALYLTECPETELLAVADVPSGAEAVPPLRYTPLWNLQNVQETYGAKVYENYIEMLDAEHPDLAFILTENAQKPSVVEECAKRGINVCIEKPVAVSLAEAQKIQKSVETHGIRAVVNWPVAWRPYLYKMKAALESGMVGTPVKLRYINGHTGPLGKGARHRGVSANAEEMTDALRAKTWWHQASHGGGVWLDICCYGCYFAEWLLGAGAESVVSLGCNLNTPFGDTDDNFAALVRYPDKMAVLEGTWTTPRAVIPSGPMVLCTEGVVTCVGGAENNPDVKAYDIYGNELPLPDVSLEESMKNMPCHLAAHPDFEVMEMLTLEQNIRIMAMLDAAMQSCKSGKEVPVEYL